MSKILLAVLGLAAIAGGVLFGWIAWSGRKTAERLQRLPRFDRAFLTTPVGSVGLLEGHLAADNPAIYEDLLLYVRSRFYGWRGKRHERHPIWETLDSALPGLWIETAGGRLRISEGYSITLLGSDPKWTTTDKVEAGVTERYEGLRAGQLVTVVGRLAQQDGERYLEAEMLASGSAADTLAGERSAALFGRIASLVLLIAGAVLVFIAWQ